MGKNPETMTMAEHAIAWWEEQGNKVPAQGTAEWESMYAQWVSFAFQGIGKTP